jgi:hypothetical protein
MQTINVSLASGLNPMPQPSHLEIAQLATQLWEMGGRPSERDVEFWLEAEQKIQGSRNLSQPKPTAAAKNGPTRKIA